jgi:putative transposase
MLEYKSNWNDKNLIKIDKFYPSSKTCSSCGWINQNLTLDARAWKCQFCRELHDRDFNDSKNILKQGLKYCLVQGLSRKLNKNRWRCFR